MGDLVLQSYGCTDIGYQRSLNEDYIEIKDSLFVLADGMGGHNAGDIASRLAVETIIDFFDSTKKKKSFESDNNKIQDAIKHSIIKTNELVYQQSLNDQRLEGMGTTIVLAFFKKPGTMHIANVGDSRAYLLRDDKLKLLTEDHSVTASLLRDGTISKVEAKTHPYRHHLTRSIGTSNEIQPFATFFNVSPGDKLLLCSDGLWNVLSDEDIIALLQKNVDSKKICYLLTKRANELQSKDNVSSIVIDITEQK